MQEHNLNNNMAPAAAGSLKITAPFRDSDPRADRQADRPADRPADNQADRNTDSLAGYKAEGVAYHASHGPHDIHGPHGSHAQAAVAAMLAAGVALGLPESAAASADAPDYALMSTLMGADEADMSGGVHKAGADFNGDAVVQNALWDGDCADERGAGAAGVEGYYCAVQARSPQRRVQPWNGAVPSREDMEEAAAGLGVPGAKGYTPPDDQGGSTPWWRLHVIGEAQAADFAHGDAASREREAAALWQRINARNNSALEPDAESPVSTTAAGLASANGAIWESDRDSYSAVTALAPATAVNADGAAAPGAAAAGAGQTAAGAGQTGAGPGQTGDEVIIDVYQESFPIRKNPRNLMELRSNAIAFDTGRIIRRVYNRSALLSRIHDWSNLDLTTDKQPYLFMSWDHVHSAVNDGVPAPGTAPAAYGSYEGSMASSSHSDASLNGATPAQTHGGTAPAQSVTAAAAAASGAAVAPADAAGQDGRDTVSTAKVRAPAATATAAATVAPSGVATGDATAAGAGESQGAYMKAVPGFPGIKAARTYIPGLPAVTAYSPARMAVPHARANTHSAPVAGAAQAAAPAPYAPAGTGLPGSGSSWGYSLSSLPPAMPYRDLNPQAVADLQAVTDPLRLSRVSEELSLRESPQRQLDFHNGNGGRRAIMLAAVTRPGAAAAADEAAQAQERSALDSHDQALSS
ncbi:MULTISPECIES: hypothetical protein [unclassified Anaerobiospirillum]|uniref:hypothetical protein n=1 Tax=unclassified Anaerobiospirillum TaxID=2647410 RepID=UPI001FF274AC|nr:MULTISPECIES: hypothetical protein [unclassified Anaerobiospirillum]MCK0533703.1 hypothetical protein [Anaerobiospirillum sp. NML120511]MCK0540053.1 hypothetical protein [Anaerobiospirillum sp. NML02-A-032]